MTKIFSRFIKDESGATAIEYGLIAALIAIAVIGGARLIGGQLDEKFNHIADELATVQTGGGGD